MKVMLLLPLIAFGLFFGASASAVTPAADEVAKLIASDGAFADSFGYSVALDGDTALIGAYCDDDLGSDAGSVYVFIRDSAGAWSLQQKLTASDGASNDEFGYTVAVDGDTAVIGTYGWDFFDPPAGSAYVFTRDSAGVWTEQQKLTASDGEGGDFFGYSVAVSVDTAVIGAFGDSDIDNRLYSFGSVYVFTRDSAGVWSMQQKLTASDGKSGDGFGRSVAADGDTILIAAWGDDASGTVIDSGAVYVFTRDGVGVWIEQQKLTASVSASYYWFGKSVAMSGDTAVIGAHRDDDNGYSSGASYVFTRDSAGVWTERQKLTASDAEEGDNFGLSVAVDGDSVVVGAYGDNDNDSDSGSAYVFTRDSAGVWIEQLKLLASDGLAYDYLGYATEAVAVSGSTVLAGAPLRDTTGGANAGAAYLFDTLPGTEGPDITVIPTAVQFGDVSLGLPSERTVTLSNYATSDLTLYDIFIASGIDFTQSNDCPSSLPAVDACQITVKFVPTVEGQVSDSLTILSNDPDEPAVNVALSGSGILQSPDLTVNEISAPRTLSPDKLATVRVTIGNQGDADVTGSYSVSLSIDGVFLEEVEVSDLPLMGTETEVTLSGVRIPELSTGNHTLKAVADTYSEIPELDEENNSASITVKIR